jgi:putative protease
LYKTFNRGFTTYFLHGRQPDIFSPDTPKALGEYVGRVKELRRDSFNVAGTATFANGDGLCFFNADNELEGFRVNRAEGNRLFPQQMPTNLHPGVSLYRNNDQQFERLLSRPSSERRILIRLSLGVTSDGFSLSAEPVGTPAATPVEVTIACEHQQAAKPQHDNIVRQLSKLGGTIYECSGVDLPDSFGYFIPNSTLTDLRRRLVEALNGDGSRCVMAMTQENRPQYVPPHFYDHPYLYNIANRLSCEFYGVDAPTAYELRGGDGPIMQCRHCLRYALGRCRKNPADRSTVEWREPLFLRLGDGRRFRLEFDCKHCQMNVYAED